ncbi:MAG TPA: SIMPL domain-containing protein [Clostridiaceae bacterium]|nr:SIMPL domain-containing protein [Clostridiaceae bacterium]
MKLSNKHLILFVSFVLVVVLFVLYGINYPLRQVAAKESVNESVDEKDKRVINVSGLGIIKASPDIAYITLGFVTEDTDANEAQKKNAKQMDKIVAAIKDLGIEDEDIKTVSYNIYPKYDYDRNTGVSKIIGYSVNNSVQVTVRDILKTGKVIDIASENGANTSGGISFGLSDYEGYYNNALKAAVENAKKKADIIADTLGVSLKLPVSITENSGYQQPPTVYYSKTMDWAASDEAERVTTPIESGTLEIRASVAVIYEY